MLLYLETCDTCPLRLHATCHLQASFSMLNFSHVVTLTYGPCSLNCFVLCYPANGKELACQVHDVLTQAVVNVFMPHLVQAPGKLKISQDWHISSDLTRTCQKRTCLHAWWGGKLEATGTQNSLNSHTEPRKTLCLSFGHLFRGATDIRIVSDLTASLEHTSRDSILLPPREYLRFFDTEDATPGNIRDPGIPTVSYSGHRESPSSQGNCEQELSPAVQLGIRSPDQSEGMYMLQSLSANLGGRFDETFRSSALLTAV